MRKQSGVHRRMESCEEEEKRDVATVKRHDRMGEQNAHINVPLEGI